MFPLAMTSRPGTSQPSLCLNHKIISSLCLHWLKEYKAWIQRQRRYRNLVDNLFDCYSGQFWKTLTYIVHHLCCACPIRGCTLSLSPSSYYLRFFAATERTRSTGLTETNAALAALRLMLPPWWALVASRAWRVQEPSRKIMSSSHSSLIKRGHGEAKANGRYSILSMRTQFQLLKNCPESKGKTGSHPIRSCLIIVSHPHMCSTLLYCYISMFVWWHSATTNGKAFKTNKCHIVQILRHQVQRAASTRVRKKSFSRFDRFTHEGFCFFVWKKVWLLFCVCGCCFKGIKRRGFKTRKACMKKEPFLI